MDNHKKKNQSKEDKSGDAEYQREMEKSMKEENDALVGQVFSSVKMFKRHAMEMNDKIVHSNEQCEDMDKKYTQSNNLLGNTINQLNDLLNLNSNKWFYIIVFIIIGIFILRKITK